MKKLFSLAFLIVSFSTACAQSSPKEGSKSTLLTVNGFSPDYYGKIYLEDTSEFFSKGWVAIYDQKTNKRLLKVEAEKLAVNLRSSKTLANIRELPYSEQSVIRYADFNFDGSKDLALEDGLNSCYQGASYQVYLATKNGFALNAGFTHLAQEYCGMFEIDEKKKQLRTMSKSGYTWQEISDYVVKDNQLCPIRIEGNTFEPPLVTTTLQTWEGKNRTSKTFRKIMEEEDLVQHLFSFTLEKNNKKVVLLSTGKITLHYVFLNSQEEVELAYPMDSQEEDPTFHLQTTALGTSLTFSNKEAKYEVYENKGAVDDVGIKVTMKGKVVVVKGIASSVKGTLSDVSKAGLDNLK